MSEDYHGNSSQKTHHYRDTPCYFVTDLYLQRSCHLCPRSGFTCSLGSHRHISHVSPSSFTFFSWFERSRGVRLSAGMVSLALFQLCQWLAGTSLVSPPLLPNFDWFISKCKVDCWKPEFSCPGHSWRVTLSLMEPFCSFKNNYDLPTSEETCRVSLNSLGHFYWVRLILELRSRNSQIQHLNWSEVAKSVYQCNY